MGLLDTPLAEITDERIKKIGFHQIGWGAPKYRDPSRGRWDYRKRTIEAGWGPEQIAWEFIDNKTDYHYVGVITYFPPTFDGYVTCFVKEGKLPAGYAYIYIDNDDTSDSNQSWYELMPIEYADDLKIAKDILVNKLKAKATARPW